MTRDTHLETLSAAEFVTLRARIRSDYAEGRVRIVRDGWIVSETEHALLAIDADEAVSATSRVDPPRSA